MVTQWLRKEIHGAMSYQPATKTTASTNSMSRSSNHIDNNHTLPDGLKVKPIARKTSRSHVCNAAQERTVANQMASNHVNGIEEFLGRTLPGVSKNEHSLGPNLLMIDVTTQLMRSLHAIRALQDTTQPPHLRLVWITK